MSRLDGKVTSEVSDVVLTIPQVSSSPMAMALYVQFQAMAEASDSVIAQQAFTAETIDRVNAVNQALQWLTKGEAFDPEDKANAFQAYLDLLAGGIADESQGLKDYAAFRQEGGPLIFVPYASPQEVNINEQAEIMNLPLGQFSSVSIAGGPRELYYRGTPPLDDPGAIPPPIKVQTQLSVAPDGQPWVSTVGAQVPPGAVPGTYLRSVDGSGNFSYYRAAANSVANSDSLPALKIKVENGLILFSGSAPVELSDVWNNELHQLQDQLSRQSKTQANYLQYLVGQLMMLANGVTNSLQRVRHAAATIVDRGMGGG